MLKTVVCRGPPWASAVAGGTAASTLRLADARAASAPTAGAPAELGRAATGDPITLISRPSPSHVGLDAVAENWYAVDGLDEAEMVGAGDVPVVAAQGEPGDGGRVKSENVGMRLHIVKSDGGGGARVGRRQEAVQPGDAACRPGQRVDGNNCLFAEFLAECGNAGLWAGRRFCRAHLQDALRCWFLA